MEMQQIRYYLALAETLNFTRAAGECNVTQPALTRAIQALEGELGGELIRREGKQSHLTELGRRMLPLLQQCYGAALSAKSLAKAVKSSDIAPVPLAVSNGVNIELFIAALGELFRAYPGARIKIWRGGSKRVVELLKNGEVELAVAGPLDAAWDRLDAFALFEEPIDLAIKEERPLGKNAAVDLSALAGETLLQRMDWESGEDLARALSESGIEQSEAHEVESDAELFALVKADAGVGFVARSAAPSDGVRRVALAGAAPKRVVSVYSVAGRPRSPAAAALLNLLRAGDWAPG